MVTVYGIKTCVFGCVYHRKTTCEHSACHVFSSLSQQQINIHEVYSCHSTCFTGGLKYVFNRYHGCCQYHKSMSIPWVFANTMSLCLYHESMSKQWDHVYTMSPCLYHKSDSIPWVHVYTISLCRNHDSISIPWEIQFSDIQKYK